MAIAARPVAIAIALEAVAMLAGAHRGNPRLAAARSDPHRGCPDIAGLWTHEVQDDHDLCADPQVVPAG